ncbi:MAG: AAA family ATPase [Clostridiales bacterium]|nr:AAA family ATPase [Clostridiales bacterium]
MCAVAKDKIQYRSLEDVVEILSRQDRQKRPKAFTWERVGRKIHQELLYKVADELNLSSPRFVASKDLEEHRFEFINYSPLNGLYSYYKNNVPRKPGEHIIKNVCDNLGIPDVSPDEWIYHIGHKNIFSWKNISDPAKRKIFLMAAKELGYSHPIFFRNEDFSRKFDFLNGRTLTGFYTYFRRQASGIRGSVIKYMCDSLNIEIDYNCWIEYITSDSTTVFWDIIPSDIMHRLLLEAGSELGYTNPRMMSTDDLKIKLKCLKGISLYSFVSRFFGAEKDGVSSIDYICNMYDIPPLSFNEWVALLSRSKNYNWDLASKEHIRGLLFLKVREHGKDNPRMLKYEELNEPTRALGGKTLTSLYTHFSSLQGIETLGKETTQDVIEYMCETLGVPRLNTDQWIFIISRENSKVKWDSIPKYIKRDILYRAAYELGFQNPRFMNYNDLANTRFELLGGKTLSGLYYYFSSSMESRDEPVLKHIFDELGVEELSINEWITAISNSTMVRWERVPRYVQREIVIRAAAEMGLVHPRLMGTREFDSVELAFLNNKTLCGLYYHYAAKVPKKDVQINEYLFNVLNIPKLDINPRTGRLSTIDNKRHKKYFDSRANMKSFINSYLKLFPLESLCRKYSAINNAKKADIYKRGLVTVLAPLTKKKYLDFLYDHLKSVPRDVLGLRKPRNGDYRLRRSDLYRLVGIKEPDFELENKIQFAEPDKANLNDAKEIVDWLNMYTKILEIQIKTFHHIDAMFLVTLEDSVIYQIPVALFPGDIIHAHGKYEFEVLECREKKMNDGYIVELKSFSNLTEEGLANIDAFARDSNDSILLDYINALIYEIENDVLDGLLAIVLGLKNSKAVEKFDTISDDKFYNKDIVTNSAQRQGVELALSLNSDNPLVIVQGPPGTGKTTLIEEIALQYYNRGKDVLIMAKTNIAVDNVLEKLAKGKVRVLRTGNNIEFKSTLSYAPTISTSNPEYLALLEGKNKIVLGTPMGFLLDRNFDMDRFDILIIDEASQMNIPETLFALQFANRCVMIGDHLQIPPFPIQNEILMEYDPYMDIQTREDLQRSLFELLITDKYRFNSVFLDINYRTQNPQMVSLISDLVYDGGLTPNLESKYYKIPKSEREKFFPSDAIEIIDTSEITDPETRAETEVNSTYFNLTEAMLSIKKVMDLLVDGKDLNDICIITPYKAHAEKIKELFMESSEYFAEHNQALGQFINKNIYTIDSFQGREQDIVIINWVRSNYEIDDGPTKTGFLRDFRRVNVALSRAKTKLVLIGDFETLTKSDNMKVQYIFSKLKELKDEEKIVL